MKKKYVTSRVTRGQLQALRFVTRWPATVSESQRQDLESGD